MKKTLLITAALALLGSSPALALSFYLSVDAPSDLSGSTHLPTEILRNNSGAYVNLLTLADNAQVDALFRRGDGKWLFSVEAPTMLGGNFYEPRDVIERDNSGAYSLRFDGLAEGVPAGVAVDAVYEEGVDLVMSFDVPVSLGGTLVRPADLVHWSPASGFTLKFDSFAAGVPESSNVTAVDVRAGLTILSFDVFTDVVGGPFFPGELVAWDGIAFALYYNEPNWPENSRVNSLAFLPGPGQVPTLLLNKFSATELTLSWSDSCSPAGADDYNIYRGTLGTWYDHQSFVCGDTDGVALSENVPVDSGSYYYLVVPFNDNDEGSYGLDSAGVERPMGAPVCLLATQETGCP